MKMNVSRWKVGRLVLAICLTAFTASAAVGLAAATSSNESIALWQQACRRIIAGDIDAGAREIQRLSGSPPAVADFSRVHRWLADYEKLQKQRDGFRQGDFDYEIAMTKESLKKGEWLPAVRHLSGAYDDAKNMEAFAKEEWTVKVVNQVKQQAEAFYRKGEWTDAASIYAYLENIYEDNPEYETKKRLCLRHARLELIYKKENQSRWEKDLEGIEPSMVRDAFQQVGRHYVRNADFKAAMLGGIENLKVLATTTNLAEAFPQLGDREAVVRFVGEITTQSNQIKGGEDLNSSQAYDRFKKILNINGRTLKLPEALIISEFMDGALYPLDRFSSMIWPSDLAEFKKHTMGRFQGVGIQIRKEKDGKLIVVTPLPNTPAQEAGIRANDVILKVDGEDISSLEIDEIVPKIMGPKGTSVRLTIQRGTGKPFDVSIQRDVITIVSVRGWKCDERGNWDFMLDPEQRIGYVRIDPSFMDGTTKELKDALRKLNERGAQALILDLRFNPGGLLRTAIDVTDLFLPKGKRIVSTRGQHSDDYGADSATGEFFTKDLVVLVNELSASASEILAGALQDHHRAVIIGSRTHGKGSVQNLIPLAGDTAYLKLTTALYYLPSDRCPDKHAGSKVWGVVPDIAIPLRPEEKIKVVQMRRDSDVLATPGQGTSPDTSSTKPATSKSTTTQSAKASSRPTTIPAPMAVEDRPDVDPQVEAALLVLRVKLLTGQPWGPPEAKTARMP